MRKEIKNWWKKGLKDISSAKKNFDIKEYEVCIFLCQQSVEKAFKALLLKKTGKIKRIHDLVRLGNDINLPKDLLDDMKELTLAYVYSRYPDVETISNLKEKASKFLESANRTLRWVGKKL